MAGRSGTVLGVSDGFFLSRFLFGWGGAYNCPDAKHAMHCTSQLHLSLILVDIHQPTYRPHGLSATTTVPSRIGRELLFMFLGDYEGLFTRAMWGRMMIFRHPSYMTFFVFCPFMSSSIFWLGFLCPRTLPHIEHEKCLVRFHLVFWLFGMFGYCLLACILISHWSVCFPTHHIHGMLAFSCLFLSPTTIYWRVIALAGLSSCFR